MQAEVQMKKTLVARELLRIVLLSLLGCCVYRAVEMEALKWVPKREGHLFVWGDTIPLIWQMTLGLLAMKLSPGKGYCGVIAGLVISLFLMPNF